ncbi:MAG: sigma-70 family RNA polymerase sigma factor [Anaerolineae bacterium]
MDERQALARLRRGDIGGLDILVQLYQVKATRTAFLITRDRALAEDIMQAAFLRVHERIHQFDPERPFEPWFMRVIINDAVKAASRSQRQVSIDADLAGSDLSLADILVDPAPDPADEAERLEIQRAVWEAMAKLTPKQRAVAVLRYYLGYGEAEMAEYLTLPAGTVKWRLHAARERLSKLLMPLWNESVEG